MLAMLGCAFLFPALFRDFRMSLRSSSDAALRPPDSAAIPGSLPGPFQDIVKQHGGALLELADLLNDSVIVVDGHGALHRLGRDLGRGVPARRQRR